MILVIYEILIALLEIVSFPFLYIYFRYSKQLTRLVIGLKEYHNTIWFHAASVGEVNAIKPLIMETAEKFSERQIILTTMTKTGQKAAQNFPPNVIVTYLPVDLPFMMNRFFKKINPNLIVIMETELWPQMLLKAKKYNVPVLIVNGRLTEKSLSSYQHSLFFWKHFFPALSIVNAQSESDAEKFNQLKISNAQNKGNLKFAVNLPDYDYKKLRQKWGFMDEDFIIVLGSSRPGEEKLIFDEYVHLKTVIDKLKIIIAPRHLKRVNEIKDMASAYSAKMLSDISEGKTAEIIIIDKMGILVEFYALCDLAIIGGSFFEFGGHNPLEAAFYAKPVIMGNDYSSCSNSVDALIAKNGIVISDKDNLSNDIIKLHSNEEKRISTGKSAKKALEEHAHVLKENLESIDLYLNNQ